jgi:hypothetical protein
MSFLSAADDELDSSDEFYQLRSNLPRISLPEVPLEPRNFADPGRNDFTRWQLNRFNRSGNITVCSVFSSAYHLTIRHFRLFILLYVPYAAVIVGPLFKGWLLLFVSIDAISSLCASSCAFAIIANDKWHSRLRFFFTKQGIVSLLIQMMRSLLLFLTVQSAVQRASTLTGQFLFSMIFSYVVYFHPCFMFEGVALDTDVACWFTLQLSFIAVPFSQSLAIFLLSVFLHGMGPFTFGLSVWTAYVMRVLVFLAVCGTGNTMTTVQGL